MSDNKALVATTGNFPILDMDPEQAVDVLVNSLYPGAKRPSVLLVLGYCRAARLDPLDKPVHIVPMPVATGQKDRDGWDITEMRDVVMQGIGLHRTKAMRTGQWVGLEEPVFGPDVTEKIGDLTITYPQWCKVTAQRLVAGEVRSYVAKEFWKECYAQKSAKNATPNRMWAKRIYSQLAKCAEAQALRKAFPDAVGAAETADEGLGRQYDFDLDNDGNVTGTGGGNATGAPAVPRKKREADAPTDAAATPTPAPGPLTQASTAAEVVTAVAGEKLAKQMGLVDEVQPPAAAGTPPPPPAPAAATETSAAKLPPGKLKNLQNKIASIELDDASVASMLARHGATSLETLTDEQFDAVRAELISAGAL